MQDNFRPVVQTRAAHGPVIKAKARRPDDMQRHTRRRAETRDITRVGWNLRLDKRNVKHKNRD
jgi:hypothetical protein